MRCLASNRIALIIFVLLLFFASVDAGAQCKDSIINPVTDIDWQGVFPIKLGGITLIGSDIDTSPDNINSPVCVCSRSNGMTFGISASFWEPARLVDTVKDPYCFVPIGTQMSNPDSGFLGGVNQQKMADMQEMSFQQAHWMIFPVWPILDLFTDLPCIEKNSFDIAYITEIDPTWNNSLMAMFLNPEALLFANPVAQLAGIPDAIASNANYPLDPVFWEMGSWGSAYPLSGSFSSGNYTEANAGMAARMIYKLSREGLLWDTGLNRCGPTLTPIWVKTNYRLQIVRPVRGSSPQPIGRSGLIWAQAKNPPGGAGSNSSDNFLWLVFRRVLCCIGVTF